MGCEVGNMGCRKAAPKDGSHDLGSCALSATLTPSASNNDNIRLRTAYHPCQRIAYIEVLSVSDHLLQLLYFFISVESLSNIATCTQFPREREDKSEGAQPELLSRYPT